MERNAKIERKTKETCVSVSLSLDGGSIELNTGIGFFDHMLHAFAFYAGIGLTVNAVGDLQVDGHHTVEDIGLTIGEALRGAFGDKTGIRRFASAYVPMDEALLFAALDVSGRPYLVFDAPMPQERCGEYDTCLTVEFMRALANSAGLTLHLKEMYGQNAHHITEGLFKALGLALKDAKRVEGSGVTSTKGLL